MKSMYQQFQTDTSTEKDGVWVDYGRFKVRVARAGGANKAFQKEVERLARPYRRAIATNSMDPELAEDLLRTAYAKTIVRGWETNVDGQWVPGIEPKEGGELLPVTPENILATFQALPDLYEEIKNDAGSWALYWSQLREEAAGN